jgi:hypothetical protein
MAERQSHADDVGGLAVGGATDQDAVVRQLEEGGAAGAKQTPAGDDDGARSLAELEVAGELCRDRAEFSAIATRVGTPEG